MEQVRRWLSPSVKKRIPPLARHVAKESYAAVLALVEPRAAAMTLLEARGYVRAMSGKAIRREVRVALGSERLPGWAHTELVQQASERVVHAVLRTMMQRSGSNFRYRRAG